MSGHDRAHKVAREHTGLGDRRLVDVGRDGSLPGKNLIHRRLIDQFLVIGSAVQKDRRKGLNDDRPHRRKDVVGASGSAEAVDLRRPVPALQQIPGVDPRLGVAALRGNRQRDAASIGEARDAVGQASVDRTDIA
ncbi:hypothetical protein D3C73_956850 [compost metagenome]